MLIAFALSSCSTEQSAPTGEEAVPREVTKEVTRTVTVAETSKAPEKKEAPVAPVRAESSPAESDTAYITVTDGALSVEVPSSWGEIETGEDSEAGSGWSGFAGESVDYSLTAAPSLDSWSSVPGAPGIYAVASSKLAQRYANEELVAAGPNDLSGSCEAGLQRTFEREPYSGFVQDWANCGEDGGGYLTLAATPQGEECVVLLTVGTAGPEGEAAGQHALDTFGVACVPLASELASAEAYEYGEEGTTEETTEQQAVPRQYVPEATSPQFGAYTAPVADAENTVPAPTPLRPDQYGSPLTDEPLPPEDPYPQTTTPSPSDPPSSDYPPFPGDPNGDLTCDEVGGGPYSVPPGSDRDSDGDGIACE